MSYVAPEQPLDVRVWSSEADRTSAEAIATALIDANVAGPLGLRLVKVIDRRTMRTVDEWSRDGA